jgi:O-antigen/teichoic acid export membrane protein
LVTGEQLLKIALGRLAQILLLVLTMRVATTFLPPAELARFFLISSAVALYGSILLNPVGMFMNRRFHAWNSRGLVSYYYGYFWAYLIFVAVIASLSIIVFVHANLLTFHTEISWLVFLIFASVLISTVNTVVIPGLNMLGKRASFILLTIATTATSLIAGLLIVILAGPRTEYWLIGILMGQLLVSLLGWKIFYKHIHRFNSLASSGVKMDRSHARVLWKFAWPILIGASLIWVQSQSYRFIMENSMGLVQVGLFAAGYGISAGMIAGIEAILTSYFQPTFYRNINSEDVVAQGKAWTNYAEAILQPLLPVGFLLIAVAPELTALLLGANYAESSQFIVWGAIAELARVAYGVYGMAAHARMKTNLLLLPSLVGVIVSIAGTILLMPKYGAHGVGIALALAGIAMVFVVYNTTRYELIMRLSGKTFFKSTILGLFLIIFSVIVREMLDSKGLLASILLLFILALVFLTYQYLMFRHLLLEKDNV